MRDRGGEREGEEMTEQVDQIKSYFLDKNTVEGDV